MMRVVVRFAVLGVVVVLSLIFGWRHWPGEFIAIGFVIFVVFAVYAWLRGRRGA